MARVLVNYAHPGQRHSRINRSLARCAEMLDGISFVDLYASYPRFNIDVDQEQLQLLNHDVIILQFPLYWYSTPALLKEWQDLVLEYGFAYGPGGDKLAGKYLLPVVTAGAAEETYQCDGSNCYSLRELLAPLEQTAALCQVEYLPPYVLFSAHQARDEVSGDRHISGYQSLLTALRDDHYDYNAAVKFDHLGYARLADVLTEHN